jgi:solute carrier family 13 (sodium-dependent dicarboxylate transporter), member 2/3/5
MKGTIIGAGLSIGLLLIALWAAPPTGLSSEGFRTLCLTLVAVVLWCAEVVPVTVTAILLVVAIPALGIETAKQAFATSGSSAFFFLIAAFGICAGLLQTRIPQRLMSFVFRRAGNDSRRIMAGYILVSALVSVMVTDAAATVISAGLAAGMLRAIGNPAPGTSRMAKGLMIAIPFAALTGGISTPASNAINIIAIEMLRTYTGREISFFAWAFVGVPVALLSTLFLAWWLPRFFAPEAMSEEQWRDLTATVADVGPWTSTDKKFLGILAFLVVAWISGTFIPAINDMALVAIVGMSLMFLPGIDILSGKDLIASLNAQPLILVSSIMILASAVKTTGAGDWLVQSLFVGTAGWPALAVFLMISLVALLIHTFVPTGSACVALAAPLLFGVATAAGVSAGITCLLIAIWCGITFLLPVETTYMLTYTYGHYRFIDVLKAGIVPTIVLLALSLSVVPLLGGWIGL